MSEALKPVKCGCGGEPVVGHIKKTSYLPKDRWYIGCPKCDICTGIYDTEAEAVTAWNTAMGAKELKALPSAEPERIIKIGQRSGKTLESAIVYLHSVGWLQEHDRILTESVKPQLKWIPVTEALPKNYEQTICIDSRGKMMIGMYGEYGWTFPCYMTEPVAWMPLPEPYRGE